MAWFDQFFSPYDFFPGGPARIPGAVPITPQNTLPSRNGYYPRDEREVPDMRVNVGGPQPAGDVNPVWNMIGVPTMTGPMGPNPHGQLGADLMYSPNLYPGAAARNPARNPVPAASPPPASPPTDMMPGGMPDTLPAINSVPYAGKVSPAGEGNPPRNSFDWGPDASLWSMLTQGGAAMMQPSWYGLGGQLGQGLTAAGQAAQQAPMQRAQRKLLEAQVGKAEQETDARKQAMAIGRELPAGHPAKRFFQMGMIKEGLEKLEPDLAKDLVYRDERGNIVVNQTLANVKAYINAAGAMKPQYGITGYDRDGKPIHGWTTPPTMPGASPSMPAVPPQQGAVPASTPPQAPPAAPPPASPAQPAVNPYEIPPAPQGVNEAEWRKNWADIMSKRMAAEGGNKESALQSADVVIKNIDEITKTAKTNWWATGGPGWLTKGIPGTPTYDMAQRLETVKANVAFDALARMRAASPTGGALGQVAIEELRQLQNSLAAMSNSQSKDAFIKNMGEVRARYEAIVKKYGGTMPQAQPPSNEGWKDMGNGFKMRPVR